MALMHDDLTEDNWGVDEDDPHYGARVMPWRWEEE